MLVQLRPRKKTTDPAESLPRPAIPRGGKLTVIMKATNICNIACTFCSVGPAGKEMMAWEDFEHLAEELERTIRSWELRGLELTFHGGEPTALGADWIERACWRMLKLPARVTFSMQTNLVSFNDKMVDVARRHDIRIGSSIDPIFGERVDYQGRDTYERWVANYRRLTAAGFRIGAIFIVTKQAVTRARELYQACEALNQYTDYPFGLQVQPVYSQGRAADSTDMLLQPEELGAFFVELYDEWERSGRSVSITPVRSFRESFDPNRGRVGLLCSFGPGCATSHVGVDHDLNLAGCGRRLDSDSIFGNLKQGHLEDILLDSLEKRKLAVRTEVLRNTECYDCRFFRICHGGCPDDAHLAYDDVSRKFYWCKSYMALFEAMEADAMRRKPASVSGRNSTGQSANVAPANGAADASRGDAPARGATTVVASDTVSELFDTVEGKGRIERWVLPSEEGRPLDSDSDLPSLLEVSDLVRLWVPNRHVKKLRMWQDFIQHVRTRIVLFEGDDELSTALNLLNGLGANVIVDVQNIAKSAEGVRQLSAAVDRFLHDPLWKARLAPFAQMLRARVEGVTAPWINRWGLQPGSYTCVIAPGFAERVARLAGTGSQADSPGDYARSVIDVLERERALSGSSYRADRSACGACDLRGPCGSQLSPGAEQPCSSAELALVRRIDDAARQIVVDLKRIGEDHGAPGRRQQA